VCRQVLPALTPGSKGGEIFADKTYAKRPLRRPIETLFGWIQEKTGIQTSSKVRSERGLMVDVFGPARGGDAAPHLQLLIEINNRTFNRDEVICKRVNTPC
jgi:hypothetical protein